MSTWDDKPNDYEHALAVIERLRALLKECADQLEAYTADERGNPNEREIELVQQARRAIEGIGQ